MERIKKIKEHEILAKGAEAHQIETPEVKIKDPGVGQQIILRRFEFQLPPGIVQINKKLLLQEHIKKLQVYLWKDELEMCDKPRLHLEKNGRFSIFILCRPKKGSIISWKAVTEKAHDILQHTQVHTG